MCVSVHVQNKALVINDLAYTDCSFYIFSLLINIY